MRSKIYNGISGALKIICAVILGIVIGGYAIHETSLNIPFYSVANGDEVVNYAILLLAISGYIGVIFRGISQMISLFKPEKPNYFEVFCIDVLSLIFIIAAWFSFIYYAAVLYGEDAIVWSFILYVFSIILILIDAIIMVVKIKKANIKFFDEAKCLSVIRKITRIVVPVFVIALVIVFKSMISDNLVKIELNKTLEGGFDSFTMSDFDGNEYTEDIFKGHQVNMINIWGTFCGPCIREMPELEEVSEMYDKEKLQMIGIPGDLYVAGDVDSEQVEKALEIIEKTGAKYLMLIPSKEIQAGVIDGGGIRFYPTTIFLNEEGEQIRVVENSMSKEAWIEVIEDVLASEDGNR